MDIGEISIGLGSIGALVFACGGLFNWVLKLKNRIALLEERSNVQKETHDKLEITMFKKFTTLHARNEAQSALNTEFKELFVEIRTNLKTLIDNQS